MKQGMAHPDTAGFTGRPGRIPDGTVQEIRMTICGS